MIGASTGTMAFCMNSLVTAISYFRWDSTRYYIDKGEKGYGLMIFIGLAICYSLISAVLVSKYLITAITFFIIITIIFIFFVIKIIFR